jgi:hypothetical protein
MRLTVMAASVSTWRDHYHVLIHTLSLGQSRAASVLCDKSVAGEQNPIPSLASASFLEDSLGVFTAYAMTALSDVLQIRDCQPEHCNSTRSQSAADRKTLLANRRLGPRHELTQEPRTLNGFG